MIESLIQILAVSALPVVFAITLHEAAHGYAARHFGDPTAWLAGRISLNPVRHIDPLGTVIIPIAMLLFSSGSMLFGYAKPVPVDIGRLRNPRRDMIWVAAAGPAANLAMALGWAVMANLSWHVPEYFSLPLARMAEIGIGINVVLMVLNLLPLPPLDGGRIVLGLLPDRLAWKFAQVEPWGIPILLVLIFVPAVRDGLFLVVAIVKLVIVRIFGL